MEELKALLRQADDEYLTGLSNKGTVKRAYKDLEQEKPEAVWNAEGAQVTLKEAVCQVRIPLGSSVCSCPSRSICRHLITAVLYLKQEEENQTDAEEPKSPGEKDGDGGNAETGSGNSVVSESSTGPGTSQDDADTLRAGLEEEITSIPLNRLKQACKNKGYREFLLHMEEGEFPVIEEGSVVTVRFPWEDTVVKLLSPLAYSTCTCHRRELCTHKAQAILAFRLQKKTLTLQLLKEQLKDSEEWDFQELARAVRAMKEGIGLQLLTGLSRLSPEAAESMERLAVISHGAGLPAFESGFRSAASEYQQYFQRSPAFREEVLLERLLFLYFWACRLEREKEPDKLRELSGSFRDAYRPVSRLHLMGIGGRNVISKAGYEGERYYFLEAEQRKWYTWTDLRPTFYEGVRRPPAGSGGRGQAPWGLNCSRERMAELEFYLSQAKATEDGRLSVSQDTKSEIVGGRDLSRKEIQEMIVWDYRDLLKEIDSEGREKPALVGAAGCREGRFDTVRQRFSMEIIDRYGRSLYVAVNYSKEEKLTIRVLERLSSRLKTQERARMVFFGIPYLEEGRLCLYPVEYFEQKGFEKPEENHFTDCPGEGACVGEASADTVKTLEQCLLEMRRTMSDLFQSGLSSVQEETLSQLCLLARECEEMGLHRAGEELWRLAKELEAKRHRTEFDPEPALAAWMQLMEYLKISLERTALDGALAGMRCETGKEI